MLYPVVDTRLQAESQAIAGCIDRIYHLVQLGGFEGGDVQHGAEDFLFQVCDAVYADHGRSDERAFGGGGQFSDHAALVAGRFDVVGDSFTGRFVDNRTDIGRNFPWVAQGQHLHRTGQHFDHVFGDVLLNIKAPQG